MSEDPFYICPVRFHVSAVALRVSIMGIASSHHRFLAVAPVVA